MIHSPGSSTGGQSNQSGLVPYLGQVSTRCQPANTLNTGLNQICTQTLHVARENLTNFAVGFANWYCAPTVTGEASSGSALTKTASIVYQGVTTQLTFNGGSATGSIPQGQTVFCDFIKTLNIPRGAIFFLRQWSNNPGGLIYLANWPGIVGDASEFGTTTPDKTMSGTISTGSPAVNCPPVAIIQMTTNPAVFCLGDSRVAGPQDVGTTGEHGIIARSIGRQLAYINCGCGGEQATNFATLSNSVQRRALAAFCTSAAMAFGINDITANKTEPTITSALISIGANLGIPFYVGTVGPKTTSTDSWATPTPPDWAGTNNQQLDANNSVRVALNERIRGGGITGAAGFIEFADVTESRRNSGYWKGGLTSDGLHENLRACLAIDAARVLNPAMFTR